MATATRSLSNTQGVRKGAELAAAAWSSLLSSGPLTYQQRKVQIPADPESGTCTQAHTFCRLTWPGASHSLPPRESVLPLLIMQQEGHHVFVSWVACQERPLQRGLCKGEEVCLQTGYGASGCWVLGNKRYKPEDSNSIGSWLSGARSPPLGCQVLGMPGMHLLKCHGEVQKVQGIMCPHGHEGIRFTAHGL